MMNIDLFEHKMSVSDQDTLDAVVFIASVQQMLMSSWVSMLYSETVASDV